MVVACWTAHPLPGNLNAIRPADYIAPFLVYYGPLEQAATQRADWRGAADVLADVLAREPDFVRELGASRPARTPDEAKLAAYFGHIRERHAGYLAQAGEAGGAAEERRRAQELIAAGQSR